MSSNIIPIDSSPEGLVLIHNALKIAAQAHGINVSPVDLKEKMAELPISHILTTIQQTEDAMYNHQVSFIKYQG